MPDGVRTRGKETLFNATEKLFFSKFINVLYICKTASMYHLNKIEHFYKATSGRKQHHMH